MSSIRKNSIFMVLYEVAVYLAPLITAPYVARVLGTYGTGIYSYSFSIVSYFIIFVQLGVSLYGRREVASCLSKEKITKVFWGIWTIESFMFAISIIIYLITSSFVEDDDVRKALYIQIFCLIGGWLDISWLFFGVEDFKIAVSRNVLVKLISLIAVFLFIKTKDDALLYVLIMSTSYFFSVIVMWATLKKHIDKPRLIWQDIKIHITPMFKMFVPVLSVQLFSLTDKLCLGIMTSIDEVSIYDNAYRISRVPVAFITTLGTVMLPRMTKLVAEKNVDMINYYFNKSLTLTFVMGLFSASVMIGIAPIFVPIYLGADFNGAIIILQILSIVLIPIAWGNVFRTQYILPQKMDGLYLKSVLYAAIMNIVLNFILIPFFSSVGASIASISSEVIICIYQSVKIKDKFNFEALIKDNIVYLFPAIITVISLSLFITYIAYQNIIVLVLYIISSVVIFLVFTSLVEYFNANKTITNEIKSVLNNSKTK